MALVKQKTGQVFEDHERLTFEKKGERFVGYLNEVVQMVDKKKNKPFKKYILETLEGHKVSTLGTYQLDAGLADVPVGSYIEIEYGGSTRQDNGNNLRLFEVAADTDRRNPNIKEAPNAKTAIAQMRAS